jgi:hypothetical protein
MRGICQALTTAFKIFEGEAAGVYKRPHGGFILEFLGSGRVSWKPDFVKLFHLPFPPSSHKVSPLPIRKMKFSHCRAVSNIQVKYTISTRESSK